MSQYRADIDGVRALAVVERMDSSYSSAMSVMNVIDTLPASAHAEKLEHLALARAAISADVKEPCASDLDGALDALARRQCRRRQGQQRHAQGDSTAREAWLALEAAGAPPHGGDG